MSLFNSFRSFFEPTELSSIAKGENFDISPSVGEEITVGINNNINSYMHDLAQQQSATYPADYVYGMTGTNSSPEPVQVGGDPVMPFEYYHNSYIQAGGSILTSKKIKTLLTKNRIEKYCKKMGLKSCRANINKVKSYITAVSLFTVGTLRSIVRNKHNKVGKIHAKKINKALKRKKH
jgi:hypothetical protein